MHNIQKFFLSILCVLLLLGNEPLVINGENEGYYIADVSSGEVRVIETLNYYDDITYTFEYYAGLDTNDNIVLYNDEQVLRMEYGVVEFKADSYCTLETSYRSLTKDNDTSINACYGVDGAYLYSSYDNNYVYFMLADDIGVVSIDDVILHPFELLEVKPSAYENKDGEFIHKIKTQLESDHYSIVLPIDNKLSFLSENKDYYSYDGHYFYDDFKKMIDDYVAGNYDNAINSDKVYYNYFQYLPFRSLTNYSLQEVENYFYNILLIDGKLQYYDDQVRDGANDVVNKSQYYDELHSFFEYQNIYGANALMSLAVSIGESSYGKAYNAFLNNSLFSSKVYGNESEEQLDRYNSLQSSVYSFVKYCVFDQYSNYESTKYTGDFYGDLKSGISSRRSNNPYWGEKAASNYYKLDKAMGSKDYKAYSIGIINNSSIINLYKEENLNDVLCVLREVKNYPFIIEEEHDNAYKVQVDANLQDEPYYSFLENTAFIGKSYFDELISLNNAHNNHFVNITYNFGDGSFDNQHSLTVASLKGVVPTTFIPSLPGYSFVGYDTKLEEAQEDKTYIAEYKKIDEIKINKPFKTTVELDCNLDLRGSTLDVEYEDGTNKEVPITSDMISGFDNSSPDNQIIQITYDGVSIDVGVYVSKELKDLRNEISTLIDINIENFEKSGFYNEEDIKKIRTSINEIDCDYDAYLLRELDAILLERYRDYGSYCVDDNKYNASISGLAISLEEPKMNSFISRFNQKTYYVRFNDTKKKNKDRLETIASAYGFEVVECFDLAYSINMKKLDQNGPVLVSMRIPNKQSNHIYSVYRLNEDGSIVKCKTTQSMNNIEFLTKENGSFAVLTKPSVNNYDLVDYDENISTANSDPDTQSMIISAWSLAALFVFGLACIAFYLKIENKRKVLWKDYKKSLQKVAFVHEEKRKN